MASKPCVAILLTSFAATGFVPVGAQTGNLPPPIRTVSPAASITGQMTSSSDLCVPPGISSLVAVGSIPHAFNSFVAFGDADQDGRNEVFRSGSQGYEVSEHTGGNDYETVYVGPLLTPILVGDFDGDGNQELVGHAGQYIQVWESADSFSFPSILVWQSPAVGNVLGWGATGDSDRDGNVEVFYTANSFGGSAGVLVLEVVGNDGWQVRDQLQLPGNSFGGQILVGNFDEDANIEIAVTGNDGWFYLFESPANDLWILSDSDSTGLANAFSLAGGVDCDGNGKSEFFVEGNILTPPELLRTIVLEADEQGVLAHRDTLDVLTAWIGIMSNEVKDFDGDGDREYLMQASVGARFYSPAGDGTWCFTDSISSHGGRFYSYDLNGNGLPEVVFNSVSPSILEAPGTVSSVGDQLATSFRLYPNPASGYITLSTAHPVSSSLLRVYDVRGRLVTSVHLRGDGYGGFIWDTAPMTCGVYLLRLSDGDPNGTVRLIVSR